MNEDITGSITHLDTLIVVDDGVVGKGLNTSQMRRLSINGEPVNILNDGVNGDSGNCSRIDHDQFLPVSEVVSDLDIVEREGSHWEGNTRILTKEEGEGDRQKSTADREAWTDWAGIRAEHTDHVLVTDTFGSTDTELIVVIEPVVVELLDLEVVELDLDVTNEVVHQVVYPSNASVSSRYSAFEADSRELGSQKHGKDVISLARKGKRSFARSEVGARANVAEGDWDMGEPIGLLNASYEPSDGIGATIEKTFKLTKSGKVDKCNRCCHVGIRHVTTRQEKKNRKK